MPNLAEMEATLRRVLELLSEPKTDVGLSSRYASADDLRRHVCQLLRRVEAGDVGDDVIHELTLLFAPTATLEEVAFRFGWEEEYQFLAQQLDAAVGRQ